MATTHRSDLVEQLEKALTDEAYDGGSGALSEEQFTKLVRTLAITAAAVVAEGEPSDAKVEAAARRLFGSTVDSMDRARELARIALTAPPLVACPHWAPGRITFRNGCTACAADTAGGAR